MKAQLGLECKYGLGQEPGLVPVPEPEPWLVQELELFEAKESHLHFLLLQIGNYLYLTAQPYPGLTVAVLTILHFKFQDDDDDDEAKAMHMTCARAASTNGRGPACATLACRHPTGEGRLVLEAVQEKIGAIWSGNWTRQGVGSLYHTKMLSPFNCLELPPHLWTDTS